MSKTYAGFLLIDDNIDSNKFVFELLASPKDWDDPKFLKILPSENELSQAFKTTFYVLLDSGPINKGADASALACVWLDNFDDATSLGKFIESKLKNIDWESNAGDYNF